MDQYTEFAKVYDEFMDDIPYHDWAGYVSQLILDYGISKPCKNKALSKEDDAGDEETSEEELLLQEQNLVVELGCGTGSFTEEMALLGYDMIGVDNSADMLGIARNKLEKSGHEILYLEQDMSELDLFCTAGTIVSVCDSINYLIEDEQVRRTFLKVNNYLYPGGLFVFDFNTLHKYRDEIGDMTIAENREDESFIWENYFDTETAVNECDLTFFIRQQDDAGRDIFERTRETHLQRGYTLEEMKRFIDESGMRFITAIDADTHEEPTDRSERIYVLAREYGKGIRT